MKISYIIRSRYAHDEGCKSRVDYDGAFSEWDWWLYSYSNHKWKTTLHVFSSMRVSR